MKVPNRIGGIGAGWYVGPLSRQKIIFNFVNSFLKISLEMRTPFVGFGRHKRAVLYFHGNKFKTDKTL